MQRFAAAIIYLKKVLNDSKLREYYRKKKKGNQSFWNVAISDFMSKPKLEVIDMNGDIGLKGNIISNSAWDKYSIEAVSVAILNELDQVIESGHADWGNFPEERIGIIKQLT